MKVIRDDLWLCDDCMIVAVNGDTSGIESDERVNVIETGLNELGPHLVPDFDSETGEGYEEFARKNCACCQSGLAGSFHRFAVLGPDDVLRFRCVSKYGCWRSWAPDVKTARKDARRWLKTQNRTTDRLVSCYEVKRLEPWEKEEQRRMIAAQS